MILLNINNKSQAVFCMSLAALLAAGCGKKTKTETVYAPPPTTEAPKTPDAKQKQPDPAADRKADGSEAKTEVDALAVVVKNRAAIEGKTLPAGPLTVEFGIEGTTEAVEGIEYRCKIERQNSGVTIAKACVSPAKLDIPNVQGQYVSSIFAAHQNSSVVGKALEIPFTVGNIGQSGGFGHGAGASGGGGFGNDGVISGGAFGAPVEQQVGDMFSVNIPQGFHMVYRSSTFDTPGFLNYQLIDGGKATDSAAPFAYRCDEGAQFQSLEQILMPSGDALDYCNMTPSISWTSPQDPYFNSFKWMTMGTMSYNSMLIATDSSLAGFTMNSPVQPTLAKLYTTVFTAVTNSPADSRFAAELSQTSSRMQIACTGQQIEYLGNAAIFQGYFSWNPASVPLFGCVRQVKQNQFYVEIGAFPIEQNVPITGSSGWAPWIGQSFSNTRAAELVVSIGPYPYAPVPMSVAPDAQTLMIQNIKKLMPTPTASICSGPVCNPQNHPAPRPSRTGIFGRVFGNRGNRN